MPISGVVDTATELIPSTVDQTDIFLYLLIVALLGLVAFILYHLLTATPGEQFGTLMESLDSVAVLMHVDPDPDAMASALGVAEIAETRDTRTSVYYPGRIQRDENRAFETVLDLAFQRVESADEILEPNVVLVDHNTPRDLKNDSILDIVAVVDHHPGDGTGSEFTDSRPDIGACASIITEYLADLGRTPSDAWLDLYPDDADEHQALDDARARGELPASIATGLVYGIQSDTKYLTSGCTELDFESVRYLYPGIDDEKLDRMANPDIDAETLEVKARAIIDRDVRPPFAVSDVGTVTNTEAIPQAAEELHRLDSISAVVVLGDTDGVIRLAGRSDDDRVHMGKLLGELAENIPLAGAGGHARMGGGRISIEHMEGLGPGEGLTREELREQLFEAMRGNA